MRKLVTLMIVLLVPLNAFALLPPMTEEELTANSNTIVKGKIMKVECTGKFKETGCARLTGYKALMKVNETIKGGKMETIAR